MTLTFRAEGDGDTHLLQIGVHLTIPLPGRSSPRFVARHGQNGIYKKGDRVCQCHHFPITVLRQHLLHIRRLLSSRTRSFARGCRASFAGANVPPRFSIPFVTGRLRPITNGTIFSAVTHISWRLGEGGGESRSCLSRLPFLSDSAIRAMFFLTNQHARKL